MHREGLARLARHDWPGNVRELRNVIEQATVLSSGDDITAEDLKLGEPIRVVAGEAVDTAIPFGESKRLHIDQFERSYLLRALRENAGNVSRTANAIGMVRQSLQQKIRDLGLRSEDWSEGSDS